MHSVYRQLGRLVWPATVPLRCLRKELVKVPTSASVMMLGITGCLRPKIFCICMIIAAS